MGGEGKGILSFVARLTGIVCVPVFIAVAIYIAIDPFNVVHRHSLNEVVESDYFMNPHVMVNKGYMSIKSLEQRRDEGDVPDSFIFGASISCYYEVEYWKNIIKAVVMPQHFDSSDEGVGSLRRKIEFLLDEGYNLNNALIILDPHILEYETYGDAIWSMDYPGIAGWWTWPRWHYRFFSAFYDREFLTSYFPSAAGLGNKIYGRVDIFEHQPMVYDMYRNEESIPSWDTNIVQRPELFYAYRGLITSRVPHCSEPCRIDESKEKEYRNIARLLENTDYHVIVSPTLDCDTLSDRDSRLLTSIFGRERFHNFSGSMVEVALNDSNWYDNKHYRAPVARMLMDKAYGRW